MAKRWRVDYSLTNKEARGVADFPKPPGFRLEALKPPSAEQGAVAQASAEQLLQVKQRQVNAIAYSPGKNLFTTAFMLWMSGSSIQIFSIMMTGMALINPLKAIASTNQQFARFSNEEGIDLKLPKLIFISLQILSLAMALYKCSTMGLLPITSADWTGYIPAKEYLEHSGSAV